MITAPLTIGDLLTLQRCSHRETSQSASNVLADPSYVSAVVDSAWSLTGFDAELGIIGCAGLLEQWHGRAIAWAILTPATRYFMTPITRAIKRMMADSPFHRIEAYVNADNINSQRWHEMLGFKQRFKMERFDPDGNAAYFYERLS